MWGERRRPDGIASTMRQSPIINIPMNSKANASMAILPRKTIELRVRVDRCLIRGTGRDARARMVDERLRSSVNGGRSRLSQPHCEERSDEAIHLSSSANGDMDCFASL